MNGSGKTSTRLNGFAFPFRVAGGRVQPAADFEKVEANVRHLLSTRLGERVMLRTYGAGVHARLQEPSDGGLRALIRHEIESALRAFMPEVRLVAPIRVAAREDIVTITVEYTASPRDAVRRLELQT